jgi:hypothetical protein
MAATGSLHVGLLLTESRLFRIFPKAAIRRFGQFIKCLLYGNMLNENIWPYPDLAGYLPLWEFMLFPYFHSPCWTPRFTTGAFS